MGRDRPAIYKRLNTIFRNSKGQKPQQKVPVQLEPLKKKITGSIAEKQRRLRLCPSVSFPDNLPITAKKTEIIDAVRKNPVVIISGDTGSGKSTQIPKMCLAAGRGIDGKIACTQPRRIAATTIAGRIAEELGETVGESVGYKIRFKDRTRKQGYIKVLTDGMLLAETQQDPQLSDYDTIIVDEAHERSLNIDFILGILKTLLNKRKDLKLIITSATIDTEKFSKNFANAPVIQVSGRRYAVSVQYRPIDPELQEKGDMTYVDAAVNTAEDICNSGAFGDILMFMPTERDILETCERLEGRGLKSVAILPLFARLPGPRQAKVFTPANKRKVIVSTNVAETSLTIPGIKYVVDTGLARISRYLPRTRSTSLPISPISRSSADQREGRCGRLESGVCFRLYSEEDYESRQEFTDPEILRSNLAEVILRMISLKLGNISAFPFLDKPNPRSIKDGFDLLVELGAVIRKKRDPVLTPRGRMMAKMPIDPKISRMILEAESRGCVYDVAVIASALSIQDPRERPIEKAAQADQVHAQFKDSGSDFITLLNIWNHYHRSFKTLRTQNKMRKFCKTHFLSFVRMREWHHIHEQIANILKSHGIRNENRQNRKDMKDRYALIHQSVLSGYLSNIAVKKDKNIYLAARGREAMLFPGSTLFNKGPDWIVAVEMVKTSRLFARTAAKIDPEWLETLGGSLCKSTYSDPHWEKKAGQVRAFEQVTLYGLVIVPNRPVSYGPIDPVMSHEIFIRSALVGGEMKKKFKFLVHNQALVKEITEMEEKVRRRGIRVSDERIETFYSSRLPDIYDIRTLEKQIRKRGSDDFLKMTRSDVIAEVPDPEEVAQYPDEMSVGNGAFRFSYKFKPGKPDDGVTLKVPLNQASEVSPHQLDWMVPGLFKEKITALIKGLPKRYRKQLVPVSGTVDIILCEMEKSRDPLISTLGNFIYKRFGVDIPATEWADSHIPEHLQMRVSIRDHQNRELQSARDASILHRLPKIDTKQTEKQSNVWRKAKAQWERKNIATWNFQTLPEAISLAPNLSAFPALTPCENSVEIRLFKNRQEALKCHGGGVLKLFMLHFRKELKLLKKDLKIPAHLSPKTVDFGGPKSVENAMFDTLMIRFFDRDIRTETAFNHTAGAVAREIFPKGKQLMALTEQVLSSYHHATQFIHQVGTKNKTGISAAGLSKNLLLEMGALIPRDFVERYTMERLPHLPRFLRALEIRAERGAYNPDKDREKEALILPLKAALKKNLASISSRATPEKRVAFEEFFWMVEEYKVSVFAQELKTAIPVSAKRLHDKMRELERMV
ncbi:MAG: ATP-dependent RNA helicase HrpA [Deltaproteobacteria bacterium]|nr:ATP-dependent RNA helicase HrpA [Deltaproteobacteria bacterium]